MSGRPNQYFLQKADLAVANLIADGGYLQPEQAKEFYEIMIKSSELLQLVQTKPMSSPNYEQNKAAFLGQVLRPATEGAALGEDDRSKPDFGKVTLSTKEYIGEVRLSYQTVEDNIEGGNFESFMKQLLGKAVARDFEDILINGDTTLVENVADSVALKKRKRLLKTMDGLLKQVTTRTVNANGQRFSKSTLESMYRAMAAEFLRDGQVVFTSKNAAFDYASSVANRQTALGDQTLVSKMKAADFMGYPILPIPLFPEDLGGGTNETNAVWTDPKNILVGIQRQIRLETDRDISAREWIIVVTLRADMKLIHEPATCRSYGILAA